MRLDKFISNNTLYSRSQTVKIIKSGNVMVDDLIIKDPSFNVKQNHHVFLYNELINSMNNFYIALNKPKGYICSNTNHDGISILELINPIYLKNIHIVGRLDKDTTGLVLLTNDGEFTHHIKNPKFNIEKEYEVELKYEFNKNMYNTLKSGIKLDNKLLKPFEIKNINKNKLNIIICEGKHHQIKRMFSAVNNEVVNLNRVRINHFVLNNKEIPLGEYTLIQKEDILL